MSSLWRYSPDHRQPCLVMESHTLWGETVCWVWIPESNRVIQLPASKLEPLEKAPFCSPDYISYVATAARIADALTQDVLLAPLEASVIPLPHQLYALWRAVSGNRVRYLLADEVGLGKTIEAGLIMRELKLRGLVKRTLVIAPKGLVNQWVSEMRFHFGETFRLVLPEDIGTLKRILPPPQGEEKNRPQTGEACYGNAWALFPQVVVPMDAVKPLERRRGWSDAQIDAYNQDRFEDLITAGWDLVIVDEAHRLGGSTDQVARFKLGQGLAEAAPYVLLLSATPHQGKSDAFHRLMSLLDEREFPDPESVTSERIQSYVIRTEKRAAVDAEGKPLFKPRRTQLAPIAWEAPHQEQQALYEAVTSYVREGYNQAVKEKRNYIGFLMCLMQRLVVSSTRAIRTALEKRLQVLAEPEEQLSLFPLDNAEEWADLDGQEQAEIVLQSRIRALRNERAEIQMLLELAERCEQVSPDAKAEALIEWIYRLQSEEGEPELKVLVFTEFVPTQEMLRQFLSDRGFSVACLNGSMDMDERKRVQESFAGEVRILISTEAGGEGLNLQFCHVVINYDIPWNPMRLEQRIGRVDRIGQTKPVRAINFVFQDSVEYRVLEVLEQKLAVILEEFGVDKTGDVLDSAQAGPLFDEMYVRAILNPAQIPESVETVVSRLQEQIRTSRAMGAVLGKAPPLEVGTAQRLLTHPLPYWIERMTLGYLASHGGKAEQKGSAWHLSWPDGETWTHRVFTREDAERIPRAHQITLEEPKVQNLVKHIPRFIPGQPIPIIAMPDLAKEVRGLWSLWEITVKPWQTEQASSENAVFTEHSAEQNHFRRMMPLFLTDQGAVYIPTARYIWDHLLQGPVPIQGTVPFSEDVFAKLWAIAEEQGKPLYAEIMTDYQRRIDQEREKVRYALSARRKTIERIGLPQVRDHRLKLLNQEEQRFLEYLAQKAQVIPNIEPLMVIRIEGENCGKLA